MTGELHRDIDDLVARRLDAERAGREAAWAKNRRVAFLIVAFKLVLVMPVKPLDARGALARSIKVGKKKQPLWRALYDGSEDPDDKTSHNVTPELFARFSLSLLDRLDAELDISLGAYGLSGPPLGPPELFVPHAHNASPLPGISSANVISTVPTSRRSRWLFMYLARVSKTLTS